MIRLPAMSGSNRCRSTSLRAASKDGAEGGDIDFYEGKVASARFLARRALPKANAHREAAEQEDGWLMEMNDSAFQGGSPAPKEHAESEGL